MTEITVKNCPGCPFSTDGSTGIFQHTYCALGLYTGGDWREFTWQEVREGMTAREKVQHITPRYPLVIPEWCGLKAGVKIVTDKEVQHED
jgi:hypothetical protein